MQVNQPDVQREVARAFQTDPEFCRASRSVAAVRAFRTLAVPKIRKREQARPSACFPLSFACTGFPLSCGPYADDSFRDTHVW